MAFFKNLLKKEKAPAKTESAKKIKASEARAVSSASQELSVKLAQSAVNESEGFGVIIATHMTEKTVAGSERGEYTFRVHGGSNKISIRRAVEARYGVDVEGVRTTKAKSKIRRMGRRSGILPGFTKAVVKLAKGQRIELN